jgi:GTP:adenosylcobinamide-phosphate guanylyltransferase
MMTRFAVALAGAVMLAWAPAAFAKECKTVAAAGSGLTQGIAEVMAKGGVKTLIDSRGMTAVGDVKVKCKDGGMLTECHALQKACK